MSWMHFSDRPAAKVHYFANTPWAALSATTACGVSVFINCLHILADTERARCRRCLKSTRRRT